MSTLILNHLLDFQGSLFLCEDFDPLEGSRSEIHYFDEKTQERAVKIIRYTRRFVIQIAETKPKKVSRKCEFYVTPDRTADSFFLIYIKDNQCLWKEPAPVSECENGDFVFDLTDFLRSKNIEYAIPKYRRISFDDKLRMSGGCTPKPYGASIYLSGSGSAYDGSGLGYIHYLMPGYLTCGGIGIGKLFIRSYAVKSISDKVNEVLSGCPRELSKAQLSQLLLDMCSGNEIEIATGNFDIRISRHYSSGIKLTAFGETKAFNLPRRDCKHSIGPDAELLEKIEKRYALMLLDLMDCTSFEEADKIVITCLDEIETL